MSITAIDPGTSRSAAVTLDESGYVSGHIWDNADLVQAIPHTTVTTGSVLVVEQIESYGMAVGREIFETVFWSGRFVEAWRTVHGRYAEWHRMPRRTVKLHLCGSPRAKDANIRQALIDRYGGKAATKKGGPLYGIKADLWAALALAVTYQDQQAQSAVTLTAHGARQEEQG